MNRVASSNGIENQSENLATSTSAALGCSSVPPEDDPQLVDQENDRDRIIAELTRANNVLKANISCLYRTARAEIARKNDRIAELQASFDDLLFKRMNRSGQKFQQQQSAVDVRKESEHKK